MTKKTKQGQLFTGPVEFDGTVDIDGALDVDGTANFDGVATFTSSIQANVVAAGATLSVTQAAHDGRTIVLDQASGSVATLPAATGSGAVFNFLVSVSVTTNNHIIQVAAATDDLFLGHLLQTDTDTSDTLASYPALAADTFDTITMNGGTKGGLAGDRITVRDVAAGVWLVEGLTNASGVVATPWSSAISS